MIERIDTPKWTRDDQTITQRREIVRRCRRVKLTYEQTKEVVEREMSQYKEGRVVRHYEYGKWTFYNDLGAIRQEDKDWAEKTLADNLLSQFRATIESYEETQRQLRFVASQAGTPPQQKINAFMGIAEIDHEILQTMLQGPALMLYDQRMAQLAVEKAKRLIDVPKGETTPKGLPPEDETHE